MAYIDKTGRHTVTAVGVAPVVMDSVDVEGGKYLNFIGTGALQLIDNLDDFKWGTGPACIELIVWQTSTLALYSPGDWPYGNTIFDGGRDPGSGVTDTSVPALSGANAYDPSICTGSPSYSRMPLPSPIPGWRKLRYDISAAGVCTLYVDGTVVGTETAFDITSLPAGKLFVGASIRTAEVGYTTCKVAALRITKASRGASAFNIFDSGSADLFWSSTVLQLVPGALPPPVPPPDQTVSITGLTDAVSWTTANPGPDLVASGTLSAALLAGQVLRVSFDGGTTWVNATVSETNWTRTDPSTHTGSWDIRAQVVGSDGQFGALTTRAVTLIVWPTLTFEAMTLDSGTIGDWITYNGAAGRTVSGTLSSAAPTGSSVQLSSDGVSWTTGSITGLSWAATDPLAHTASWTYQARLVSAEGLVSTSVSQEVFLTTPPADFSPQGTFTKCLDLIRRFCQRTGLPQPTYVIGNQDIQIAQLMGLLEESLEMLVRRPERGWQVLTREALFVTKNQEVQGSLSNIAPGMIWITDQTIFNRTTRLPMYGPLSPEERQLSKALQTAGPYYRYWIVEDQLHLYPVPPAGQLLAFEYVSTYAWVSGDTTKPRVYRDSPEEETDICVLPRDVVLADLRWRWKKEKGLEYAQDFESFELLFARATSNDGMRRDLSMEGTPSIVRPGILVPAGSWPITGK